ncbi:hypothetical protein [Sphingomonas sp. 35-24ZXX]|uniref:hypothetical protein n=1 Tax=Sphingomonas sp. 35-24ZXX TaxID=1545915 RepID=UPI00053BFE67|nr:hypothetical protein [Sphingomonas sp. 35-24ZXX]
MTSCTIPPPPPASALPPADAPAPVWPDKPDMAPWLAEQRARGVALHELSWMIRMGIREGWL